MEAAHIPWRPLGRLLVEQGLLTDQELEFALTKQQTTGRRLGETIVECGFVSPPDLSNALAAQYGIELVPETGFGTGLRAQIQRRHESDRGLPALTSVPDLEEPQEEASAGSAEPTPPPGEEMLLAQLEEQWAKLAAAEEWLAEREVELAVLAAERDRRHAQAERLVRRARAARLELVALTESADGLVEEQRAKLAAAEELLSERERELAALAGERDRRRAQAEHFVQRARSARVELAAERDRRQELAALTESAEGRIEDQSERLAAAEALLSERERELAVLAGERDRRRAQAARFFARLRVQGAELRQLESAAGNLEEQHAQLAAAERRLGEHERELAALAADRDRRRAQVVRFAQRVYKRDEELAWRQEELHELREVAAGFRDQAERLAGDVRGCDAEIERLRRENERRRAQAVRFATRIRERPGDEAQPRVVRPSSHLVFVQLTTGYELLERDGPPPQRHSPLELPGLVDGTLVVAGSRPSPFPGDARPCVIAQRL